MSFDLYFCASRGSQTNVARVQRHMNGLDHITESQSNDGNLIQFEYSGPATEVYCLFDLSTKPDLEQAEALALPDGYAYADLSVSINFLRPHFFALELMPIVSGIAESLGLSLYDPQAERMYAPGTSSDVLAGSWIEHNEKVTRDLAHDKEAIRKPYLPREQSLYWWKYTRAREDYQNSLVEDVFVPSILLMVDAENRVKLTVIWSAEVQRRAFRLRRTPLPQVLPVCDYVMLAWGKPGTKSLNKAIVPYSVASASLAALLEDMDGPVEGLRVLRPYRQSEASEVFDALPKVDLGTLKQISSDGFVDVSPA